MIVLFYNILHSILHLLLKPINLLFIINNVYNIIIIGIRFQVSREARNELDYRLKDKSCIEQHRTYWHLFPFWSSLSIPSLHPNNFLCSRISFLFQYHNLLQVLHDLHLWLYVHSSSHYILHPHSFESLG